MKQINNHMKQINKHMKQINNHMKQINNLCKKSIFYVKVGGTVATTADYKVTTTEESVVVKL